MPVTKGLLQRALNNEWSVDETSQKSGFTVQQIYYYMRREGIPVSRYFPKRPMITPGEYKRTKHLTVRAAAKKLHYTETQVRNWAARNNKRFKPMR